MTARECPNCLAAFDAGDERCPVCWVRADGRSGALTVFDDLARDAIRALGGVEEIFVSVPARSHLVWCEAGLFRFDVDHGIVWRTPTTRHLDGVGLREGRVRINDFAPDGGWQLDWATGAAV